MFEAAKPIVLLLHVLAAFAYRGIRRDERPDRARASHGRSRVPQRGAALLDAITGIATALIFGYSLLSGWVLVAVVLYALIIVTGIFFWGRVGRDIDRGAATGDDAAVRRELRRPRNVAISRLENLVLLTIIVLMVLRPS